MPINASPHYLKAEREYLDAETTNQKIMCLQKMITLAPKHKSSENLLKELKTRLKKLKYIKEKEAKKSGSSKKGIRKEGFQTIIIGMPNSGKSSLLKALTNATPNITPHPFTTTKPELGSLNFQGVPIQILDLPPINSEHFDKSFLDSADLILITLSSLDELSSISPLISNLSKPCIYIMVKVDILTSEQKRKLTEQLKSKRLNGLLISSITLENIPQLKEQIFQNSNLLRVYTKEPHKQPTPEPIVLHQGATVKDAAEKILKGFSKRIKQTRITGPSSKFPNQQVSLNHQLKDKDIIEFHTI